MDAEQAYLFRHVILRDAAYNLHLPGERGRLHGIVFEVLEQLAGGRPTGDQPLDAPGRAHQSHSTDPFAFELADHARLAEDRADLHLLYLQRAAAHAEQHFQTGDAIRMWKTAAELTSGEARGGALKRAGVLLARTGRMKQAAAVFEQARDVAVECDARRLEGEIAAWIAQICEYTGGPAEAEQGYEDALAILRETHAETEVSTLGNLGCLFWRSGRHEEAEKTFHEVLTRARASGDRLQEGKSLSNLAGLYRDTGRKDLAEQTIAASLEIARALNDRYSESLRLGNLASLQARSGKLKEAEQNYVNAAEILTEVGDQRGLAVGLGELAGIHLRFGELDRALAEIRRAVWLSRQVQARHQEAVNLHCYAQCLLATGESNLAREIWSDCTRLFQQLGETQLLEQSRAELADACAKAGVPPLD